MNAGNELVTLLIDIEPDPVCDAEELEDMRRELFNELKHTNIESIQFVTDHPAPQGTKGAVPIGAEIAIALLAPMIPETIEYIYRWVKRKDNEKITIKSVIGGNLIEIKITASGDSGDQVTRFIESLYQSMTSPPEIQ